MTTEAIYVYISCGDIKEARKIAAHCVTENLASCGNILPNMETVYRWDGDIHSEQEVVLILKTRKAIFDKVEKAVKSLHSYKCPCICALPVEVANAPYLQWINDETNGPSS